MGSVFPAARTVTYAGSQHITFLAAGSPCVNRHGLAYLLRLRLPETDTACRNAAPR